MRKPAQPSRTLVYAVCAAVLLASQAPGRVTIAPAERVGSSLKAKLFGAVLTRLLICMFVDSHARSPFCDLSELVAQQPAARSLQVELVQALAEFSTWEAGAD